MRQARENCMQVECRNCGAFQSRRLKSDRPLPLNRFAEPDLAELLRRLTDLADVRPTIISRGKALVTDPSYPNPEVVREVGRLLADKL